MKPILTKTEKVNLNGQELTLVGESYEAPIKSNQEHDVYSQILIKDWRGMQVHSGFSYIKPLSDDELQFELDFHARNIKEKPNAYGL